VKEAPGNHGELPSRDKLMGKLSGKEKIEEEEEHRV